MPGEEAAEEGGEDKEGEPGETKNN